MLTEKFLSIILIGVDPVLWVLIIMSVFSWGVIFERLMSFYQIDKNIKNLTSNEIRLLLDKRLGILATFGNNAPFIGLFGTVLGIIQAFHVLGVSGGIEVNLIMMGISEALVATAVGLFVAIPCVIAYNFFARKMKRILLLKESDSI